MISRKIIKFSLALSLYLFFLGNAYALPDAVCGNGKHVGNPHCGSSVSPAPLSEIGTAPLGAGIIIAAGLFGLWRRNSNNI